MIECKPMIQCLAVNNNNKSNDTSNSVPTEPILVFSLLKPTRHEKCKEHLILQT